MNKEDMKVGMLIKHEKCEGGFVFVEGGWDGSIGVIIKLKKVGIPNEKGEIPLTSYPDIFWQDGQIGPAHCQYLEVISESR